MLFNVNPDITEIFPLHHGGTLLPRRTTLTLDLSTLMGNAKSTSGSKTRTKKIPAAESGPAAAVLLQVTLWSPIDNAGMQVLPSALAMAGDLLAVSSCEIDVSSAASITATFPDVLQAIKAARHLDSLLFGFYCDAQSEPINGCIALSKTDEPSPSVNIDLLRHAHSQTQPGDVIVIGKLCETARLVPGLQFQALSGGVVTPDNRGHPRTVLQLLPPPGRYTIPEKRIEPPPAVAIDRTAVFVQVAETPTLAMKPMDLDSVGTTPVSRPASGTIPASAPQIAAFPRTDDVPHRSVPVIGWVAGVAAVVAVAAGILVRVSHKPQNPQAPTASTGVSVGNLATTTPPISPDLPAPPVEPRTGTANPAPIPPAKGKLPNPGRGRTPPDTDPKPQASVKSGGVKFFPTDIPYLMGKAERDSGDGRFTDAIREYRIVLELDPANAAANAGLARAIRNEAISKGSKAASSDQ